MNNIAVFTIVSNNYMVFARTLMQSLAEVHPEWERHVLLVDRPPQGGFPDDGLFTTTAVEELPLPDMQGFLFRYSIMELNTAVKPWMFAHLRQKGYRQVIYLDPDIFVLQPMVDVVRMLHDGATAVLTPHLTAPLIDDYKPTELDIMRAGAYNLGFLAVGDTAQADALIAWWQRKLEFQAVVDFEKGLFTDQKWLDLAPGLFEGVGILRDTGYNVAYWNLSHRPLTREGEQWYAGGRLLRFFHFSGFNPEQPGPFSKHQDRFTLDSLGVGKELAMQYAGRLLANGYRECRRLKYAFGCFDDGTPIPDVIRSAYRDNSVLQKQSGTDPFAVIDLFAEVPLTGLPPLLRSLLASRPDLTAYFPDPEGNDRQVVFEWFLQDRSAQNGIPERFILPIKQAVAGTSRKSSSEVRQLPRYSRLSWGGLLEFLHHRWTGVPPSFQRLQHYRSIRTTRQFLSLGHHQARRYFRGRSNRLASLLLQQSAAAPQSLERPSSSEYRSRMLPAGVHSFGFYPDADGAAWWMGREAGVVMSKYAPGMLCIEGVHHAALYQSVFGAPGVTVDILVNGTMAGSFEVQTEGHFTREITLTCTVTAQRAEILLVPRQTVVPRDAGINQDGRCLSLQIVAVRYRGEEIRIAPCAEEDRALQAPATDDLPGVNVIGYVRSEHGLGQSPRLFSHALTAVGHPHLLIDFNVGNASRTNDTSLEQLIVEHPRYPVNVFHINADQMPVVTQNLPADFFRNRYNIGFWHWELPELPDAFLNGFNGLNEVWVPTGFVHDAVSRKSPIPVVKIPHAIHFTVESCSRADFGLPEQRFLFLTMYDFSSYQERKNPKGALDAFDRAFDRTDSRVALVIKTQNSHHHPQALEELRVWLDGRDNVVWLDRTLNRQEVYNLESLCDSLLSLHRSEGFGLGPAEAMFLGKPVIATNWSATTEFMRQDNSLPVNYELITIDKSIGVYEKGQVWADPDIEHAAWLMRQVVEDNELCRRIGTAAQQSIHSQLSPLRIGRMQQERLRFIQTYLV